MPDLTVTQTPDTTRADVIAAIRAYADWLEANTDVPMPTYLDGRAHDLTEHRAAQLAEQLDGKKMSSGSSKWVQIYPPCGTALRVEHTLFVKTPKMDEKW